MKLYAFQPEGFGPLSYFVMAKNEEEARKAVIKSWRENDLYQTYHPNFAGGNEEYILTILGENEVIENCNS